MFEIKICELDYAAMWRQEWATHTISCIDPVLKRTWKPAQTPQHLTLFFEDVHRATDSNRPPTLAILKKVLRFTAGLGAAAKLLVHCHAGISRSTALAIAVLMQHGLSYDRAFKKIEKLRPILYPNTLLVQFTDDHFRLAGAYVEFVKNFKTQEMNRLIGINDGPSPSAIAAMKEFMSKM